MNTWRKVCFLPVILAALVLALPFVAVAFLCWALLATAIVVGISLVWIPRGQRYLIVYSDSGQWRPYFENEVLPAFGASARVINLSRDGGKKKWWHLDWAAYRHCAGYQNRFPSVFCFRSFGPWRSIRFYDAYMLSKRGRFSALERAKAQLSSWSSNA
jgi:hypothetical protein